MRVLVAPDKFKGSLTARQVAEHVAVGLRRAAPGVEVVTLPVADGGDGTVDAAVAARFARVAVRACGPTGEPVHTCYARRGDLAVIELAAVCGLLHLPGGRPDPLHATTVGLGQVARAALRAGCRRLVIGIGGSASTDGGAGLLQALGARIGSADGVLPAAGGAALARAVSLDLAGLDPALRTAAITVACDVANPLVGPLGAAAVYGPQKGASPQQVAALDGALRGWAELVTAATGVDHSGDPGAGAAGGVGFAAVAVLGARLRPGIELVLDLVGFADRLAGADLVVTGEGALDGQTLAGKAPAGVAAAARAAGVPTVAVAGRCTLSPAELAAAGISAAYPLTDLEPDVARCIRDAGPLLERAAALIVAGGPGV